MDANDALWIVDPVPPRAPRYTTEYERFISSPSTTYSFTDRMFVEKYMRDMRFKPGGIIPTDTLKEKKMGSYDDRDHRSNQDKIDDAVKEAIEKPRREAEIARRVAAVGAFTAALEGAESGTVVVLDRKSGRRTDKYVALLAPATRESERNGSEPAQKWHVTGNQGALTSYGWTFAEFLNWATTGEHLVENVRVAGEFNAVL